MAIGSTPVDSRFLIISSNYTFRNIVSFYQLRVVALLLVITLLIKFLVKIADHLLQLLLHLLA